MLMSGMITLTSTEPGVTVTVDSTRIIAMKRVEPAKLKSELIQMPGDDREPVTIVVLEDNIRELVKESVEEINAAIRESYSLNSEKNLSKALINLIRRSPCKPKLIMLDIEKNLKVRMNMMLSLNGKNFLNGDLLKEKKQSKNITDALAEVFDKH